LSLLNKETTYLPEALTTKDRMDHKMIWRLRH